MNYIVCIDDTDMPGTKGTGWIVQELCERLDREMMAGSSAISRHQLFVHEDIPYTSHNSAMCFEMNLKNRRIEPVIEYMADFLEKRSQKGSDPGLCVARISDALERESLVEFGKYAKKNVSSKADAYGLAKKTGIHLSEHGGTGDGVIGAVAGMGLRLSGEDGRYRGWYHFGNPGDVVRVSDLCRYHFIDICMTAEGTRLKGDTRIEIGSRKTKIVRKAHQQVLIVVESPAHAEGMPRYRTITKQEAKQY